MYKNLLAELVRNGIERKTLAAILQITEKTVSNKLNGITAFTVLEAKTIMRLLPTACTFEYLFFVDGEAKVG